MNGAWSFLHKFIYSARMLVNNIVGENLLKKSLIKEHELES